MECPCVVCGERIPELRRVLLARLMCEVLQDAARDPDGVCRPRLSGDLPGRVRMQVLRELGRLGLADRVSGEPWGTGRVVLVRLQPFGNTGHGPVPRRRGDESEQETGPPNDRRMLDDFRLWGSSRCRRMGETATP